MYIAAGKVILDYYGNVDLKEKHRQMEALLLELRKKFNVSASEVSDFDDLEKCVVGLALTASNERSARSAMKKILEHIDSTAFARVVVEDTDFFGYD